MRSVNDVAFPVWGGTTYNEGVLGAVLFEQICNIDLTPPIQNEKEFFTRLLMDFGDAYMEFPTMSGNYVPKSGGRARTGIVWEFAQSASQ